MSKFVLNADDFGMSEAFNRAVLEGYESGLLKSTSLTPNGKAFDEAVEKIIPQCTDLGVGVHLNVIEGNALSDNVEKLTDENRKFNNSFIQILIKSYTDKVFLEEVEKEFRKQIEKVKSRGINITHLDSHVHVHAIPPIFELVCKLAKEYGINQVRTQFEKFYMIPDVYTHLDIKYFINIIKIILLACFTVKNKKTIKRYALNTNDYLIGVGYTSMMTSLTVSYGVLALKDIKNITAEALIHPCRYEDGTIDNHFAEFQITKNIKLKEKIEKLGFEIGNYL